MAAWTLSVATPERAVYEGVAQRVTFESAVGQLTVCPGHVAMLGCCVPGELVAFAGESGPPACRLAVGAGGFEITAGGLSIAVASATASVDEAGGAR